MKIRIYNETNEDVLDKTKLLKKVFKKVKDKKNMNIIFLTNQQIHEMNLKYRKIDRPTDVLSFINDEEKDSNGDIFISLEKMRSQASEFGHGQDRELAFLAVHGYLHLKGYDHETPAEEKEMMDLTEVILAKSNLRRKI